MGVPAGALCSPKSPLRCYGVWVAPLPVSPAKGATYLASPGSRVLGEAFFIRDSANRRGPAAGSDQDQIIRERGLAGIVGMVRSGAKLS
jgi:hypothetical protein